MGHPAGRFIIVALAWLSVALVGSHTGAAAQQDPAVWQAAGVWLGLLDNHAYVESWNQAARVFQARVALEEWPGQAAALWEPSGNPTARQLVDMHEVTDPTDVPPGSYVQLRFECECTRAGTIQEVMLMVHEGARGWRVASYEVEPAGRPED
jgi:hypothetical protein